jgi:uncharacterized protein
MPDHPPIAGVPTTVTAFVGSTPIGSADTPTLVESYKAFAQEFGAGPGLPESVRLFFGDGGRQAWILRTDKPEDAIAQLSGVNLVCLPGVSRAAALKCALAYCATHRALLIADSPRGLSPEQVQEWTNESPLAGSDFAAIYYPWLKVADAANPKRTHIVPPSGAVAGVMTRIDETRGVWKAPAGREAGIAGIVGLEVAVADVETTALISAGVNAIRRMPSVGIAVWGARTVAGADGVQSDYKYVPVRRVSLFLEASIDAGLAWAVFEPNGPGLWSAVQDAISNFLFGLWKSGAFPANKPDEAFFVRCDATTMTQNDIDNGRLIVEIGFAPLHPAEFVIFRITKHLQPSVR